MTPMVSNTASGTPAIVVVGDAELPQKCRAPAGTEVVAVEDYLAALGEMSHRRVAVVVGRVGPMRHAMEATVRALREVNGGAKLLLVVEPAEEPEAQQAVRLGMDDYLVEPLRGGELEEVIAGSTAEGAESAEGKQESRKAAKQEIENRDGAQGGPMHPLPGPLPRGEEEAEAALVERLVSERGSIRELVLSMLRQKLGGDIAWSGQPAVGVLSGAACVPLKWKDQSLGYLVSDEVDRVRLGESAGWAARWLALENHLERLRYQAHHDELTGAWNLRYFKMFLDSILRRAQEERFRVTVLVFDIDDFKKYNDKYGHAAGDDILREAVRLMQSVVRKHDVVARIGGDEFAVIFWDADPPRSQAPTEHPHSPRRIAGRFQKAICDHQFPKLGDLAPGTLTICGGLASYPWDGKSAEELLKIADDMLLKGKGQGKNLIMLGPGAERVCGAEGD